MHDFEIIERLNHSPDPRIGIDLSVIVPTSNTESYVLSTLNTIAAQGDLRIEIIIVDYNSKDKTLDIVREFSVQHKQFPLTIVKQNKSGLGDARNFGIRNAIGKYISVLDSDDFFMPYAYKKMFDYAQSHDCDMMFCRGNVFNDATGENHAFYDDWVWDKVVGSRSSAVVNAYRNPDLFRLEPSANIRMLSREFILTKDIFYPEGMRAEDVVPHYRSLLEADRIGFVSLRGFNYRVGRFGKLTTSPADWIYDLLDAIAMSLSEALHYKPSSHMGAAMIYLWLRSAFSYGSQLPYCLRLDYFKSCSLLFSQIPNAWKEQFLSEHVNPNPGQLMRFKMVLIAMNTRDSEFLVFLSGNVTSAKLLLIRLLSHPRVLIPLAVYYGRKAFSRNIIFKLKVLANG